MNRHHPLIVRRNPITISIRRHTTHQLYHAPSYSWNALLGSTSSISIAVYAISYGV